MAGKVLDIYDYLIPEKVACSISEMFLMYDVKRQVKVGEWEELQKYIFATDTSKTTNSKLPWNNKTTIPKLCQIRDNLHANYLATMFPKRKWVNWEAANKNDAVPEKRDAIEGYMMWAILNGNFYQEISKLVLDFIDYGNCFATPIWIDERVRNETGDQVGYVGPGVQRISPLDLCFNPVAPHFKNSPKIVRSIVTLGEVSKMMRAQSNTPEETEHYETLWKYINDVRANFSEYGGHGGQYVAAGSDIKDSIFNISGFDDWRNYLGSDYAEILTFYGDYYDHEAETLMENRVVQVIDRHKLLSDKPNPSVFGQAPIYHAGWRVRPDNLWAMGPLDNLVGMQYRIDHLENLKADCFDQVAFPPLKIRGYVEDFEWGPFARIHVGDDGDVDTLSPDVQALQANTEIVALEMKMEEMSGSPREAMGFRTPGEKTAYEVQRLENAASRIFQNKIGAFERDLVEPLLNGMLELSRRKMSETAIRSYDPDFNVDTFRTLTPQDITGNGELKPVAARQFAEKATLVQDLNNFMQSAAYQDPDLRNHWSSLGLSRLFEMALSVEDFNIVQKDIRISEKAEAAEMAQIHSEQMMERQGTPSGISPEDSTLPFGEEDEVA